MNKLNKLKWYSSWWGITLIVFLGIVIFFVLYSSITGIPIISIETEYSSNQNDNIYIQNVEGSSNNDVPSINIEKKTSDNILTKIKGEKEVVCDDLDCYLLNLESCNKTKYVEEESSGFSILKITKQIKGLENNYCKVYVNFNNSGEIFGQKFIEDEHINCSIPLRDNKYYLFDYEVSLYCDDDTRKSIVGVPEQVCISLKQFPITEYNCTSIMGCNTEYEVKYKSDYKDDNPIINGFEIENNFSTQYSKSVSCKKGSLTGENPNYWYCGTFKLSRPVLDNNNIILHTQRIYAKSVFDNNFNYIKTICNDSYLLPSWEIEIS